jgi:hypothetical protein
MAPPPKPPGQRVRRNADQPTWRQLPADGRAGQPPELVGDWLESTLAWWATIWTSPMAVAWVDADVEPLKRLAKLRDLFERGEAPATALPAMQQLEDRYGLSPKARRALQWEIARAEQSPSGSGGTGAKVHRLRAVDPAA